MCNGPPRAGGFVSAAAIKLIKDKNQGATTLLKKMKNATKLPETPSEEGRKEGRKEGRNACRNK